jgi:hypothetical protein
MTTITLFNINSKLDKDEVIDRLNNKKVNGFWFRAKESKYNENEIEVDVWYEEDVEIGLKRAFSEDAYEMIEYLKMNGKEKVVRKVYCFINVELNTLEIYRGVDYITTKIKETIENLLNTNVSSVSLDAGHLMHIVVKYSSELKQAVFKYIHGLWYHIIRGRHLEQNGKYKDFIVAKPDSLRCVSIVPKIRFLNGNGYTVTINGDKGTIRMYDGFFKWRPRLEIRQIVSIIANVSKLPSF